MAARKGRHNRAAAYAPERVDAAMARRPCTRRAVKHRPPFYFARQSSRPGLHSVLKERPGVDFDSQTALYQLMRPRMLCVCRRVPEENVRAAVEQGAQTFEEVQARTSCSTGCGTCEGRVRDVIATALARQAAVKATGNPRVTTPSTVRGPAPGSS